MSGDYQPGGVAGLLAAQGVKSGQSQDGRLQNLFTGGIAASLNMGKQRQAIKSKKLKKKDLATSETRKQPPVKTKKRKKTEAEEVECSDDAEEDTVAPSKKKKLGLQDRRQKKRPKLLTEAEEQEKTGRTVFVGNLPVNIEREELIKFFRKCGRIKSARLRNIVPNDPKLPKKAAEIRKEFHPQRDNLNGYIVFASEEATYKALEMNGTLINGYHIRVDLAQASGKHDHGRSIFVGNLPFSVREDDVRNHFADCGDIENVRIIRDNSTGTGKGFGYVLFQEAYSVDFGLKLSGMEFQGRKLRVERSSASPKRKQAMTTSHPYSGQDVKTAKKRPLGKFSRSTTDNYQGTKAIQRNKLVKNKKLKRLKKKKHEGRFTTTAVRGFGENERKKKTGSYSVHSDSKATISARDQRYKKADKYNKSFQVKDRRNKKTATKKAGSFPKVPSKQTKKRKSKS